MSEPYKTNNPELDALFERYRAAPGSHVFAPLADACRKAGMLEEAIEICERGVSTHPRYASGFVVRGKCYYDLGNADQAEASFEKVLRLDANNLVALKYMGMILAERGEAEGARRHFEHILALDPNDREIADKLEELTLREADEILDEASLRGLADSAEDAGGGGATKAGDDAFVGGNIHLSGGEPATDVLATMTLAEIYASQGYRAKAAKIFREVLSAQPDNEVARERLRELGDTRAGDALPGEPHAPAAAAAAPAYETLDDVEEIVEVDEAEELDEVGEADDEVDESVDDEFEEFNEPAAADVDAPDEAAVEADPAEPVASAAEPAAVEDSRPATKKAPATPVSPAAPAPPQRSWSPEAPPSDGGVSQFKRWLDNLNR